MKSFIYTFIVTAASFLSFSQVQAQKKQTIYYPNGKVAFEGRFQLAWSQSEKFESPGLSEPDLSIDEEIDLENRGRMLSFYKDMIPSRIYEGKCRFYYKDGKLYAEGDYKSGFKNGTFKFYHPNGQLGAQQSYEWGMATGHWESWDEQGRLTRSSHYLPIPENRLQSINEESIFSERDNVAVDLKLFFGREYEKFFEDSEPELCGHSHNLAAIKRYVIRSLYHKAVKEGSFKVWDQGKPYLDMQFRNNIPAGTWTLSRNGKPAFEIIFEAGKIIKATDFLNPENNFGSPEYLARKKEAAQRMAADDVNAVDPGIPQREEIFRTVQQTPQAGYDISKYIRDNLKVPAKRSMTGTRVVVEFVVRKDGYIDNIRVLRGDNVEPDMLAEVIRVVQSMPKWKPGMQNGRPVAVYFSMPVHIKQQ